jgi:thiamine-monophosphate kinase
MGEFDLIRTYFSRPPERTLMGGGDDCALLRPRAGIDLAISTDMLVEGTHFLHGTDPWKLGWKCLAVNLSDLAAMAAEPLSFTLSLALPDARAGWLRAFSAGLYTCADRYHCELIGGDTTHGPLAVSIAIIGEVPEGLAVRRSGAKRGDDIWVSGQLGAAALGLRALRGSVHLDETTERSARLALEEPVPRVELGVALRELASAMLDLSDGLAGDLAHIARASEVAAHIDMERIPAFPGLARQSPETRLACVLSGGDDYELCFTAAPAKADAIQAAARRCDVAVTRVGRIDAGEGLCFEDGAGRPYRFPPSFTPHGFDHFG